MQWESFSFKSTLICSTGWEKQMRLGMTDVFCLPHSFTPSSLALLILEFTLWVYLSPHSVGRGYLLQNKTFSVARVRLCGIKHAQARTCPCINALVLASCVEKKKHQQNPHRRHATEPAMQHVDMITPQTATRVIDWSLTTFLKTLSVRSKTTRSNIAPSELHSPSIHLPFFSLINM